MTNLAISREVSHADETLNYPSTDKYCHFTRL